MGDLKLLYKPEAIARRVREMGRQISKDFSGETLDVVGLLDNGFVFMADLIRHITVPVRTHFVRMEMADTIDPSNGKPRKELFFTPEVPADNKNILLVDGVLQSGVTTDFLLRRITLHRPRVVKTAVFVDKPAERKVLLEPDYYGVRLASNEMVVGYGLAWGGLNGNLPYLATRRSPNGRPAARRPAKKKAKRK